MLPIPVPQKRFLGFVFRVFLGGVRVCVCLQYDAVNNFTSLGTGLRHGYQNVPNSGAGTSPEREGLGLAAPLPPLPALSAPPARPSLQKVMSGTLVYENTPSQTYGNMPPDTPGVPVTAPRPAYSVNKGSKHEYYNVDPKDMQNMLVKFQPPGHRPVPPVPESRRLQEPSFGYVNVKPLGYETVEPAEFADDDDGDSSMNSGLLPDYETVEPEF